MTIYRHLIAIIYTTINLNYINDIINYTFDIITSIATRIDLTGKRKQTYSAWMIDETITNNNNIKNITKMKLFDNTINISLNSRNLSILLINFIQISLKQNYNRILIVRSLEILLKLAITIENIIIFNSANIEFYEILIQLLCINNTCCDSFTNQNDIILLKRPPAYINNHSIDNHNDIEIRDLIIDLMLTLSQSSQLIQIQFSSINNCIPILFKLCEIGKSKYRSEIHMKTYSLLHLYCQRYENRKKFQAIHTDMIVAACSDDYIAGK